MLYVHFLPGLTTPADLAGGLVVVIDVLRASTTICHALAAGAKMVIPCLEIEEARQLASQSPPGQAILGGERGGLRITGFDLGNSPAEYTPATVGGRIVVFTTTNGTRAMRQCEQAARVIIGSFVNLSAVCREVKRALAAGREAHLLCAGTRGEITGEDVLFAGAVVNRAIARGAPPPAGGADPDSPAINDQAYLAEIAWRTVAGTGPMISATNLADHLARHTRGGRNVTSLGLAADILDAATIDRFDCRPELHVSNWRITHETSGFSEKPRI